MRAKFLSVLLLQLQYCSCLVMLFTRSDRVNLHQFVLNALIRDLKIKKKMISLAPNVGLILACRLIAS